MKKILLALLVFAAMAHAEVILGTDVSYSKANGEVTASYMGSTATADYTDNLAALTFKAGYEFDTVRVLGYYSLEDYKESEESKSYGIEVDYLIPGDDKTYFLVGLVVGKGELAAAGLNLGFKDIGMKFALLTELNESLGLEAGIQYKYRSFDDIVISGVTIEGDERQLGVYLGLNFTL